MQTLHCEQGSQEWMEARAGIATASEFHRIITPVHGTLSDGAESYINELIAERIAGVDPDEADHFVSKQMRHGHMLEPKARAQYMFDTDHEVTTVGFVVADDPLFGFSPDGLIGEEGGLELKCPDLKQHVAYVRAGGLPKKYRPQVHGSLALSGRDWWDFGSYAGWGMPLHLVRVTPDVYTRKVSDALKHFRDRFDKAIDPFRSFIENPVPEDLETPF